MWQVLRLGAAAEQRLVTLLRGRILPVALKSLRLWKKGALLPLYTVELSCTLAFMPGVDLLHGPSHTRKMVLT